MADAFTTRVRAEKPEVNANDGTWGDELNANTFDMFDEAIHGVVSVAVAGVNITLSANNGTADEARNPILILTGTPGATREISYPDVEGKHWVRNNTDATQTIKAGAGTNVSLPTLHTAKIYTDGATNAAALLIIPTGATVVGTTATQTLTNKTLTAAVLGGTTNVSGGQLAFPAAQSASADANTLDDYEEGTFTPTLSFGGASVGITYSEQIGTYTKIGNRCFYEISLATTSNGTSVGDAAISGLPFTVAAAVGYAFVTGALIDLNVGAGRYSLAGEQTATSVNILEQGDNVAVANITEADWADTAAVRIIGQYRV